MKIEHTFTVRASYFSIGSKVEAFWFRGVIIGVNMNDFTQLVRITAVLKQGAGRRVGAVQRIPFGVGEELPNVEIVANDDPLAVSSFDELTQRMKA